MSGEYSNPLSGQCTNCQNTLPDSAEYCPKCGQKAGSPLVPLRTVIRDFFDSVLNFDSRFFESLKKLFIPGCLTREFFRGRQVRYVNPLRMFFVTLLGMYAVLGITHFNKVETDVAENTPYHQYRGRSQAIEYIKQGRGIIMSDTLSDKQNAAIDSLEAAIRRITPEEESGVNVTLSRDSVIMLSGEEIYAMDIDSVYKRHNITGFIEQVIVHQVIRTQREPARALNSFIANSTWMILLLMPVLAFVLKLFYWRRKFYYVQHLVFLFHFHAAVFVVMMVYFPLLRLIPTWLAAGIPVACVLFLLAAMKNYYRQGWYKTAIKYALLLGSYLTALILFTFITVVVSLLLF